MFKDILKVINSKYNLEAVFNETLLTVTLPNGSVIYLFGIDSSPDEAEKILGQKFKLIVVDEAGSLHYNLREIVRKIIRPTLIDLKGTLVLTGTPTDLTTGLFYDVTTDKEKGWSVHKWSALKNPFIASEFKEEMDSLIEADPNVVLSPYFKQMYLGEWTINTERLVYKFDESRNYYDELPEADYHYVMGIDLGYEDATSFSVGAYSQYDNNLYILESFKQKHLLLSDVERIITDLRRKYNVCKFVIDNAGKQSVEEMKHRTGIPLEAADKTDKNNFIEIMNNDFRNGHIKLQRIMCKGLATEYLALIWDIDELTGKRKEHSLCDNHEADGTLYLWRHCYQYLSVPKVNKPRITRRPDIDVVEDWWETQDKIIEAQKRLAKDDF